MDYGLLNRGSLMLGLVACILPMGNIIMQNKVGNRYWGIISIASFRCVWDIVMFTNFSY
ncbi:hypothetical protein Q5M85_09270 [Paraclostridium bifermentans]|nr:hypothetical protein [Paraclostridium bifermentans]